MHEGICTAAKAQQTSLSLYPCLLHLFHSPPDVSSAEPTATNSPKRLVAAIPVAVLGTDAPQAPQVQHKHTRGVRVKERPLLVLGGGVDVEGSRELCCVAGQTEATSILVAHCAVSTSGRCRASNQYEPQAN